MNAQVGGGTLFTEPVLVVNQKTKFVGVNTEYAVDDQHGRRIGAVREVGQSRMKNAVSLRAAADKQRRLQVVDVDGRVLMALTRPAKVVRASLIVRGVDGSEIGQIAQKNLGFFSKVRFSLDSRGESLGTINAENWTAWDFSIQDTAGDEIAHITKTWAGWSKERFTKSDNYVVVINRPLGEPLRSLVIAASARRRYGAHGDERGGFWSPHAEELVVSRASVCPARRPDDAPALACPATRAQPMSGASARACWWAGVDLALCVHRVSWSRTGGDTWPLPRQHGVSHILAG